MLRTRSVNSLVLAVPPKSAFRASVVARTEANASNRRNGSRRSMAESPRGTIGSSGCPHPRKLDILVRPMTPNRATSELGKRSQDARCRVVSASRQKRAPTFLAPRRPATAPGPREAHNRSDLCGLPRGISSCDALACRRRPCVVGALTRPSLAMSDIAHRWVARGQLSRCERLTAHSCRAIAYHHDAQSCGPVSVPLACRY